MIVKNPNFKNNGEFHRSLTTKGKGAKDFPNSHTEVEYLGNNKFAANIGVGHRVFFDKADGNKPKKHKLTDERPAKDYVLIQGAKCCVEVYPFYAKYFDVQHEEVRLYEERWVCQRLFKAPDDWRDVNAYNPVITVEEYPEPAGDVVKVTITYDTDYGVLTVEYFQRDGNALKHNVTFKNTSGSTETFRVLQRWAGIVADKVNGETIAAPTERFKYGFRFEKAGRLQLGENLNSFVPTWQDECEAAKKMWVRHGECNRCGKCCLACRHYIEEYPRCDIYETRPDFCKEFPWEPNQIKDIPECTYSFEATGIIAYPTKLKPTILDVHPQGLKTDFVYGVWVLASEETLEIDPATYSSDNPTIDGDIEFNLTATYTRGISGEQECRIGGEGVKALSAVYRAFAEWDISSIAGGSSVTKVEFRYHGGRYATSYNTNIRAMASQPSIQSDDDAGNQVIYDDAGDGTKYLDNDAVFSEDGTNKDVGGASGPAWDNDPSSDVETAITNGWFAIGCQFYDETHYSAPAVGFYSEDKTDAADPKPTLYVEYTPPVVAAAPWSIASRVMMMGA